MCRVLVAHTNTPHTSSRDVWFPLCGGFRTRDIICFSVIWRHAFRCSSDICEQTWKGYFWGMPLMCEFDVTFRHSRKRLSKPPLELIWKINISFVRVAVVDKVTDFLMFIGKLVVTAAMGKKLWEKCYIVSFESQSNIRYWSSEIFYVLHELALSYRLELCFQDKYGHHNRKS